MSRRLFRRLDGQRKAAKETARSSRRPLFCALSLCLALAACGSGDGPTSIEYPDPPAPRFSPPPGPLEAVVGHTVRFQVLDEDGDALYARFDTGGVPTAVVPYFDYQLNSPGPVGIRAQVTIEEETYRAFWTLTGITFQSFPEESDPWMVLGQTLLFYLRVTAIDSFVVSFELDGELVSSDAGFDFRPTEAGVHEVEAIARGSEVEHRALWSVDAPSLAVTTPPGDTALLPHEPLALALTLSDATPVRAIWSVDGRSRGISDSFTYPADTPGDHVAQAVVSTSAGDSVLVWNLIDAAPVPPITSLEANSPGNRVALDLTWTVEARAGQQEVPDSYLVAYSAQPFDVDRREQALSVVLPPSGDGSLQTGRLTGLNPLTTYYIRIYAQDASGEVGFGSELASATTPEQGEMIQVTGSTRLLPFDGPPLAARQLEWRIEDLTGLTDAQGQFSIGPAYSNGHQSLELSTGSFAVPVHRMCVGPLPLVDVGYDLLLLPQKTLTLRLHTGEDTQVPLVDYVRQMTENEGSQTGPFFGWADYPVTVYVHDFVYEDGNDGPVDYAAAFEYGAAAWNSAAGEELLRVERVLEAPDASSPGTGVFYAADYVAGVTPNIAKTIVVRPSATELYAAEPEWIIIHLRTTFFDEWIARYVITHELGHALGLTHSPTLDDLMYFTVQTNRAVDPVPSTNEAYVARMLKHMGPGVESAWYPLPD